MTLALATTTPASGLIPALEPAFPSTTATTTTTTTTSSPTKRASHKKRHTKPCRYYQIGTCPHTEQEDCDFAHVYNDQLPPGMLAATQPKQKQCRYWAQGNCTNGIWCMYKHGDAEDAAVLDEYRKIALANQDFQPLSQPLSPSPMYMNGHWYPQYRPDTYSTSPPSSDTSSEEYHSGFAAYPVSPGYGPAPYEPVFPLSPGPMSPVFRMQPAPLHEIFGGQVNYVQPPAPAPAPVPAPFSRNKAASYKTKPCRYYKPGSVCPSGDACTFIHDEPNDSLGTIARPSTPEYTAPRAPDTSLPARPLSQREENSRRGYFPISWRVIGGGVLCGGPDATGKNRDDLSGSDVDLEFDENDVESDSEDSMDDVLYNVPPGLGKPGPGAALSLTLPPVAFPSLGSLALEEVEKDASMLTPTGAAARQRASSIPSTPINGHVDVFRLFSAESPGGL
ncbi:hypothetical protein HMN09_00975400 [Mycena chlorophos]|uniref:C3H1-type domain-containing protein n=1 Tax=Mycena chlorophos TaxID=658473 RepID=A0A8H6SHI1_MYCCL|nr:hypothetical protein HMN09_00975400 [Mycena chlorophos]